MALWSVAGMLAPLPARDLSTFGRTAAKAAVSWSRVRVSVVHAWPIGKAHKLHPSPISSKGRQEMEVLLVLLLELNVATKVPAEVDLYDDEGAFFLVVGGRVGRGSVGYPSRIDEIWCCAMSGFTQQMGLPLWEDLIR